MTGLIYSFALPSEIQPNYSGHCPHPSSACNLAEVASPNNQPESRPIGVIGEIIHFPPEIQVLLSIAVESDGTLQGHVYVEHAWSSDGVPAGVAEDVAGCNGGSVRECAAGSSETGCVNKTRDGLLAVSQVGVAARQNIGSRLEIPAGVLSQSALHDRRQRRACVEGGAAAEAEIAEQPCWRAGMCPALALTEWQLKR